MSDIVDIKEPIQEKAELVQETPHAKAERLLLNLRKKVDSAVTDEERMKYSRLIQGLESKLALKSEAAKKGTKDILSDFRAGLSPDQQSLLENVEKGADASVKKAAEMAEQAKNALEKGDASKWLKVAEDAAKKAATAAGATVGLAGVGEVIRQAADGIVKPLKALGDMLGEFFKMIFGPFIDMFKGIWNGFSGKTEEKKDEKMGEGIEERVKTQRDKIADVVLDEKERKELLGKLSQGFGEKISKTYFGGKKLSEDQLKKINTIFTNSLDTESLQKIANRYKKEGLSFNIGEITDAAWEVGWAFPAKVMWELSWSGIIPMWAITQNVIVNPGKSLISLTFDRFGFPMTKISMSEWGMMLDEKVKSGDRHALDMARIQLYGVNSVLWRTMWSVLGSASALGIMMADTTTHTDGIYMSKNVAFKEYEALAWEFDKIEKTLGRGTINEKSTWLFTQMMEGMKGIRANSLLLDIVAKNTVNGTMDAQKIIEAIAKNPELAVFHSQLGNLKNFTNPIQVNNFRDAIKNMAIGQSSTANWSQNIQREWSKYAGGKDGALISYLERIDHIKTSQINLLGDTGILSEKWNRMKLAFQSLKMARTGDTVNLHLETAEDISKFRSFLSVIPGGIKAISEIIPASALVISLGSVAYDAKDNKDHTTGESLMDVCKTALIPAYGTFGIIRSKTVDFGEMVEKGEMPAFSDIALTGVVWGIFMYEITRVAGGLVDMKNGNMMKWLSKLTYMHDIGRGLGQMARGARNIAALATRPIANPAVSKALIRLAEKVPKKWRLALWAVALLAAGWAYAYVSGPEKPEDIMKNLHKEWWLDIANNPTSKMKEAFQAKTPAEKKVILDELLIMHLETNKDLPKTHYDEQTGGYSLIPDTNFSWENLIDSSFRTTLQSLGTDIAFEK